jgi:hypothetical protein
MSPLKTNKKITFLCVKFFAAFFAPRLNKKHLKTIRLGLRNIYLRNCQISGLSDKTTNAESATVRILIDFHKPSCFLSHQIYNAVYITVGFLNFLEN